MISQVVQWKKNSIFSTGASGKSASKSFEAQMVSAVERAQDAAELDAAEEKKNAPKETQDFVRMIVDKINDLYEKIKNGEAVPSFQIGARSFTIEEWDKFLKQFDSLEDAIRELMAEEQRKRAEEEERQELLLEVVITD